MRFAYADPPYFGSAARHYGVLHAEAGVYDTIEGHVMLVERLVREYRDGWTLSCTSGNLFALIPACPFPADCRIGAWVKPFASFKPGVNPAYAWEPVIWRGGRKRDRTAPTVRDYCAANIAMRRGVPGAKPEAFCRWLFALLGAEPGDTLDDLFPGSGAVGGAWAAYDAQPALSRGDRP